VVCDMGITHAVKIWDARVLSLVWAVL
jgi:hypothetical protein